MSGPRVVGYVGRETPDELEWARSDGSEHHQAIWADPCEGFDLALVRASDSAALVDETRQLRRAGYVLAMALLQSPEWKRLDEEAEEAARRFLAHVTEAELGALPDTPEEER